MQDSASEPHTAQDAPVSLRTVNSIAHIDAALWDAFACGNDTPYNPFISHTFLNLLEESGSTTRETGWLPCHLVLEQGDTVLGVAPTYMKGHSQGEYVFDHHWADAYERAGGRYFPKLLITCPFTPVPGSRLLCKDISNLPIMAQAIAQLTEQVGASSAHVNFVTQPQCETLSTQGFLKRLGEQFHWHNQGYVTFDDFLDNLTSRKRKTIRQERRKARSNGIIIRNVPGAEVTETYWDYFWDFYQDTGARKWGTPYLTREAFSLLGERMPDDLLMTMAFHENNPAPIAGALHIIGGETLYGRYWGCTEQAKFLHFECCYYQAIDYAISNGLTRVEAGAQGHHKLARGYEPVPTFSAHWIPDPSFRNAIAQYLERERHETEHDINILKEYTPFKKNHRMP